MRRGWSRIARRAAGSLATLSLVALAGCGGDRPSGRADAHQPDGFDPDAPADTDPIAPPPTQPTLLDGVLAPPGAASPVGWRVINRWAEITVADPGGAFEIPVSADGVTVTVALPPDARPGDTHLLLAVSARLPELAPVATGASPLRIDARSTATALIAAHPTLIDDEPWRVDRLLDHLRDHRAVTALAALVDDRWPVDRVPLGDAAVRHAWSDAAVAVARELSPAWPDAIADGLPGHVGAVRVRSLDATPPVVTAATVTAEDEGALRLVASPSRPLALRVALARVLPDGDHRRIASAGDASPLALRERHDLLALRDDGAGTVELATAPMTAHRTLLPDGAAWQAAAARAAPTDAGGQGAPVVIPDHSVWLALATSGAVSGAEAVRAWQHAPGVAWSAARINLAAEVGRLLRWAAPTAAPCTAAGPDDDPEGLAAAAAVAGGHGRDRLLAALSAGLTAARRDCPAPDDPAAPWLLAVVELGLAAFEPAHFALVTSPDSPLPALADGRAGFATGRLLLFRGDPLAPRVDALGGVPVGDGPLPRARVDEAVPVAGFRLDLPGSRAELTDDAGRVRSGPIRARPDGDLELVVPAGVAGVVDVEVVGPSGRSTRGGALLIVPRVMAVEPRFLYPGAGPTVLRFSGDGLAPGGAVRLGPVTLAIPADAEPDGFVLTVDPASLPVGALDVAVAAPGEAASEASGISLEVAAPPVLESVSPAPLPRGASLALLARHVGPDPAAITVTLDDGAAIHPLPVRFVTPTDPSDPADDGAVRRITVGPAPLAVSGLASVTLVTPAGSDTLAIELAPAPDRLNRSFAFGADHPLVRAAHYDRALRFANGMLAAEGEFWRLETGLSDHGAPYCPLDVRPASAAYPTIPCLHWSGICDDGWVWDDTREASTWVQMSRPPGRRGGGACPATPGIATWTALTHAGQVFDTITSPDPVSLANPLPLAGPGVRLELVDARGGGLILTPPAGGAPSDVVVDLVVREATGTVVTLQGVNGVHIARLVVEGAPGGGCLAGLVIASSRNVTIDRVEVSGCATGIWIGSSSDVRFTEPATLFGNGVAMRVLSSSDLELQATVGVRPSEGGLGYAVAVGQADGLIIDDSQRVTVRAPSLVALTGDAVRLTRGNDLRVIANIGHAWRPDGALMATAATRVGTGVRLGPVIDRVRVEDTVIVGAHDGIVVLGGRDLRFDRVVLGAVSVLPVGAAEPEGNRGAGVRVAATAPVDGLQIVATLAHGNAGGGVVIDAGGGEVRGVRVVGLESALWRGAGPARPGGQPCLLDARGVAGLRVEGLRSIGDRSGLCLDGVSDALVASAQVEAASGDAVRVVASAGVALRDLEVLGATGDAIAVIDSEAIAIRDARVIDARGDGVLVRGPSASSPRLVAIEDTTVERAGRDGVRIEGAGSPVRLSELTVLGGLGHAVSVDGDAGVAWVGGGARLGDGRAVSAVRIGAGAGPVELVGLEVAGGGADGVEVDSGGDARLGPGTAVSGVVGFGVAARGGAQVLLDRAALADNAAGALRVTGGTGALRLIAEHAALTGEGADLVVTSCAPGAGVIAIHGGELGAAAFEACALPVDLDSVVIRDELSLESVGASWLRGLTVAGAVTLGGDGEHQLDGVDAVGGVHLGGRSTRGARLIVPSWMPVAADDDPSRAHAPEPRIARALPAGPGALSLEVEGAPAYGQVALGWAARGGVAGSGRAIAVARAGADGRAMFRGVSAPGPGQDYVVAAALRDGGTGAWRAGGEVDGACRLPRLDPGAGPVGLAWLGPDGVAGAGAFGPAAVGASSWSACGAAVAWASGPSGARVVEVGVLGESAGPPRRFGQDGVDAYEPSLTPDCGEVVWVATATDGRVDLWRAALSDGDEGARRVTDDDAVERTPWVTADALYFALRAPGRASFALARLAWPSAAGPAEVVYDGAGDDLWPSTSHDGEWLAWTRCPAGEAAACGLAVLGRGRGATTLPLPDGACDDRHPRWWTAPDGTPALVASRRAVDGEVFGPPRVVALSRFGRATASLTDGATPATHPGCCLPPLGGR